VTEKSNKVLPDYEKPPVIEVVAGITFQPIKALTGPYLGVLWEKFKPDYKGIREVAPLLPVIERFDEGRPEETLPFGDGIGDIISGSRTWFETTDGNALIQVQRDRFLHNWKKEKDTDEYPHYDYVISNFRVCLEKFEQFLQEHNLGSIYPLQYELTYINHVPQGEGWKTFSDLGNTFPDFSWRPSKDRFLPDPEAINWQTSFVLPERSGRLHESIRLGKRRKDGRPAFLLELTVRGIGNDKTQSGMWSWFDVAHEWIVCGFADLTAETIQKNVWRRKR
jgi:uncharacterized protein (TIGR04255 family)